MIVSSEVFTPTARRRVQEAFGKQPFEVYAATETAGIAAECEARGGLHLFEDLVVVEPVDDANRPVPPGELSAKILVTVLFSRTQPLIRYEMSDRVRISTEACPCGRPFQLVAEVGGRSEDVVVLPGRAGPVSIHPVLFDSIMERLPVRAWQVVASANRVRVRVADPLTGFSPADVSRAMETELRVRPRHARREARYHRELGGPLSLHFLLALACVRPPSPASGTDGDSDTDTDADTDSDSDADTDSDSDTDSDTDTDTDTIVKGYVRVDDGAGTVAVTGESAAIAPDGTIIVSWVDDRSGELDVYVARSTDGGATFAAPDRVDGDGIEPLITMARHPWIDTDGSRIVVSFAADGRPWVFVADVQPTLTFEGTQIGDDADSKFMDFPQARIAPDGEIWVTFHAYPDSGAGEFIARESNGYASVNATSGAAGVPCECCPHDLLFSDDTALIAYRNNVDDDRDMWTAVDSDASGAFDAWTQATVGEETVLYCPMEGPRLARISENELRMAWSSAGGDAAGDLRLARSSDNGISWDEEMSVPGAGDSAQASIARGSSLWVADAPAGEGRVVSSSDGWSSWSVPETLDTGSGVIALPALASGAGMVVVAGATPKGRVYVRRLE